MQPHHNITLSRRHFLQNAGLAASTFAFAGSLTPSVANGQATTGEQSTAPVNSSPIAPTGEYQALAPIFGTCDEQFIAVRDVFAKHFDSGQDTGASVAIFVDGEAVVDLWGGYFDATYTRPFGRNSIVQLFSSTKTMLGVCALVLADRGELDLNAPVAKYWPEFAAEGKAEIEVRQLLGHTSGLAGWNQPMTFRDLYDWEKSTTLLARQAPWWKPGRVSGYHGHTQGYLVGEVVRRITGKTLGTFLAEELAGPLGVGLDYYIGTPEEADPRVSLLMQGAPQDQPNGDKFHDQCCTIRTRTRRNRGQSNGGARRLALSTGMAMAAASPPYNRWLPAVGPTASSCCRRPDGNACWSSNPMGLI